MAFIFKNKKGFSVFIVIILISAAALLIANTAALTGIDLVRTRVRAVESKKMFYTTEGCVENALQRIHDTPTYSGGALNLEGVNCVTTVSGSGKSRTVRVQSTATNGYTRDIEVILDWSSGYRLTSWRERTD